MRPQSTPFRVIPITSGKSILIDESDVEFVTRHRWQARRNPGRGRIWYVWRTVKGVDTKSRATTVYLHRVLLDAPKGMQVDHINGNPLDNRRANLRLCTTSENHANKAKPRTSSKSGFKGVRVKANGRFEAHIKHRQKWFSLGCYGTAEDAARAYDAKARELFGEFARLNLPAHDSPSVRSDRVHGQGT